MSQQPGEPSPQQWNVILNNVPQQTVIHALVPMDDAVSRIDDLAKVWNRPDQRRVKNLRLSKGLADNLDQLLDDELKRTIHLEVVSRSSGTKICTLLSRPCSIMQPLRQPLRGLHVHTRAPGIGSRSIGSTDS